MSGRKSPDRFPAPPLFSRVAARWEGFVGPTTRKSLVAIVDQAAVSGTNFVTTILIGRAATESELGLYSLGFAIVLFVVAAQDSLITLPHTIFGSRVSGESLRRLAGAALVQHAALVALAMLTLAAGTALFMLTSDTPGVAGVIAVLAGVIPLLLLREFGRRIAFARLRMRAALAIDLVVTVLQLGALALLAFRGELTAVNAFLVTGAATGIAGGGWLLLARRSFDLSAEGRRGVWGKHWAFGRWVFAGQLASVARRYSTHWILAFVVGTAATGVFSACLSVVALSNPFILAMCNVLNPKMAKAFADGGPTELWRVARKVTAGVAAVMISFAAVLFVVGGEIVRRLYGESFAGNGAVVSVLVAATVVSALDLVPMIGLRAVGRADATFRIGLFGLATALPLALLLARPAGLIGVSGALLVGNAVAAIGAWVTLRQTLTSLAATEPSRG